jgi:hypothetical protein
MSDAQTINPFDPLISLDEALLLLADQHTLRWTAQFQAQQLSDLLRRAAKKIEKDSEHCPSCDGDHL